MSEQLIAGRYEVISELGSGGNALVYKVLDRTLQKICALKTLKVLHPTANQIIRFQREAKALSSLSHPNVITVFHFDVTESNQPYLVMEYLEGETLASRVERGGPLAIEEALIAFTQICDGMSHSHAHNILHRDLAPANIMLVPVDQEATGQAIAVPFRVCIFDFGLAKIVAEEGEPEAATKPGIAMGSPPYMSPEHALGKNLDQRSDVYSMGCIMYESLTGVPPILADSPIETMTRQITEEAPLLSANSMEDFPNTLEKIVSKALRKDPLRRFQSIDDLNAALGVLWNELNLGSLPQTETHTIVKQKPKFKLRRPRAATIAALLVVALGGALTTAHIVSKEPDRTKVAPLTVPAAAQRVLEAEPADLEQPDDIGETSLNQALAPKHLHTNSKEGEQILYQSLLAEGSALDWILMPWEDSIVWSWKMTSDKDILKLAPPLAHPYISIYNSSEVTAVGLNHLASLPVKGLGLGKLNLHTSDLILLSAAAPTLEVLYIEENQGLRDYDLELLHKFPKLRLLSLGRDSFTDAGLARLKGLKNLEILKLESMDGITGSGLSALQELPKLTKLTLSGTRLKQAGWIELGKLKRLKSLNVSSTEAHDKDLQYLAGLSLERVDISRNPITDKSLAIFYPMKHLTHFRFYNCDRLSGAAILKLRERLPNCFVDETRAESARKDPLIIK